MLYLLQALHPPKSLITRWQCIPTLHFLFICNHHFVFCVPDIGGEGGAERHLSNIEAGVAPAGAIRDEGCSGDGFVEGGGACEYACK